MGRVVQPGPQPKKAEEMISDVPIISLERYERRPYKVDCWSCNGFGYSRRTPAALDRTEACEDCWTIGLDIIPWAELFMIGREKDVRE